MVQLENALKRIPKVVSLEVTTRCNLDCVYCTKKSKQIGDIDLELARLNQLQKKIDEFDRVIVCGIGESFCYSHIYELVKRLERQKITIVTNGTVPIKYAQLNEKNNIEMLIFSIDALKQETLNQISGQYSLHNLLKNLGEYQIYRQDTGKKIHRVLNCTLNIYNMAEILDIVEFANEHHFETVHFSFPRGQEQFIAEHQNELDELLRRAWKKALSYGIYFANPFDTCCVYLKWVTPYISIHGDFFACAETLYLDQKLGNVFQTDLINIWNSTAYKEFQNGMSCKRCKFLSNCKFQFKR